jgi:hypothetical protein
MIIRKLAVVIGIAGVVFSIQAQDTTVSEQTDTSTTNDYHLYHACEFSLDAFGVAALDEQYFNGNSLTKRDFRYGGGAGANFFFTKYIGIGADAYALSVNSPTFVDTAFGNLIFRVPICNTGIAPYIFGGAGYQFEKINQVVGQGGAGIEFRLVPHFSIFVDARFVAAAKTSNYGLGRAGVRISF